MLTEIHVNHLITIDKCHLEIEAKTTVITGETGAGKSILIDAILLALGNRAENISIRDGQDKAEICVTFDVKKLPDATLWLQEYGLANDTKTCLLRRVIYRDGRSKCFINDMPTTLQPLRELGELLIQIHGQHEHQSLLKPDYQRKMLDKNLENQHLLDQVHHLADEWKKTKTTHQQLSKHLDEQNARRELLDFQVKELQALQLIENEFQILDQEHKQLTHADTLIENVNTTLSALTQDEENNALKTLRFSLHKLEAIRNVNPKITSWIETLHATIIQISDLEDDLCRYLNEIETDPNRLAIVDRRISALFETARKYKVNPQELYELQHRLITEINELQTNDQQLIALTEKLHLIEKDYTAHAEKLSEARTKTAKQLSAVITKTLRELSLPHAEFEITLEREPLVTISPHGLEKIIFKIKTNPGQTLHPLAKIASGGELSRVGLAIYMTTARQYQTPTLIFDEVDVGIGGGTAEKVGKLLRNLGQTHQVLCITHQPQVAALGHHHLCVTKTQSKNSTKTEIKPLTGQDKIDEIARMLGGVEITKTTLAHANEMIENIT